MRRRARPGRERPAGTAAAPLVGAVLGDLEGPVAVIDEHGRIDVGPGEWRLEWGVGADDRWHVAHDEVAVRQRRVDDAPVHATWMRVPGGDVVQRAAVVNDGDCRAVLVEFENASPGAVTVALVAHVGRGGVIDADTGGVDIDGTPWIRPERPAGGVTVVQGEPWPAVVAGPDATACRGNVGSGGAAAIVLALAHRQRVRVVAVVEGDPPVRVPTPESVAAGWRRVTAAALTVELPDRDLGEAWRRILPDLVVQAGSHDPRAAAEAAVVLDRAGLPAEADRARATVVAATQRGELRGDAAAAALRALASRDVLAGRPSGLDELAGPLAAAAADSLDAATLDLVAKALAVVAPAAANDARSLAGQVARPTSAGPLTAPGVAATRVLDALVENSPGSLDLLPAVPSDWWGHPVDVRGLVTDVGTVSFSVRWHGSRPALLWERDAGPEDAVVRCPGLDPAWSTTRRRGEALLAAPRGLG